MDVFAVVYSSMVVVSPKEWEGGCADADAGSILPMQVPSEKEIVDYYCTRKNDMKMQMQMQTDGEADSKIDKGATRAAFNC